MIYFLKGIIEEKTPSYVILSVGGVGYEINISTSTYERLPNKGDQTKLYIWESAGMYSNAITLYGFLRPYEKELFLLLREIPQIGTKGALEILSKISNAFVDFKEAILRKDIACLTSLFSLTNKKAEKLVSALKDKILRIDFGRRRYRFVSQEATDAIRTLIALGYKESEAKRLLDMVRTSINKDTTTEQIVKLCLKYVNKNVNRRV